MELYELSLNHLIEVKLLRLNKPKFNYQTLPLTGSYNSIENLEKLDEDKNLLNGTQSFEKKFQEFNINEYSSVPIDNMFQINSSFGKVLFCEFLEGVMIINNTSDRELKIREIKVKVSNEVLEGYESMFRKTEYNLINLQNIITIPSNQFYNLKIRLNADVMCKYSLEVDLQYTSSYFNDEFMKHSSNKIIKTISSHYFIEGNSSLVIKKFYKKFLFATNLPFKIKDKFVNDNMERCFIEVNLINHSPYNLHIEEILLKIDGNEKNIPVTFLQEFKNFNMESDEEINVVFILNNYKTAVTNNSYVVKVCWKNSFDSVNKYINYVLKNKLNTYNDTFDLFVISKPILVQVDEFFKIIFQLQNKTSENLSLKISNEKQSDNQIDVTDIIEEEVKILENGTKNFTLICKCEMMGSVFLPKITITEENTKKSFNFEKLLNFNSVENIKLI